MNTPLNQKTSSGWMVMRPGFLQLTSGRSVGLVGAGSVGRIFKGRLARVPPVS